MVYIWFKRPSIFISCCRDSGYLRDNILFIPARFFLCCCANFMSAGSANTHNIKSWLRFYGRFLPP